MATIGIIIISIIGLVVILSLLWLFYQLKRNNVVYNIRVNWINTDDYRHYKYTYEYMHDPHRDNWWGLKYPKDKHY